MTAQVSILCPMEGAAYRHLTVRMDRDFSIPFVWERDIFVRTDGTKLPMAQRASEPQIITSELDEITASVVQKLGADGMYDIEDVTIIRRLKVVTMRQGRQAEIDDTVTSIRRIGMTPRNQRKVRDLWPDEFGPSIA